MSGYQYDADTNILIDVFKEQFKHLNPNHISKEEQVLKSSRQELDNDDLGRSFYNRLSAVSPVHLIDFEKPKNNKYHFTAEFTCKRDQNEFRPDITLFINGLPLVFIEVKKLNNHGGMVAESKRMNNQKFPNKKFRRFINITQLMIFSNNMEYDTMGGMVPIQGAFYCTAARKNAYFNCFREENPANLNIALYICDYIYKDLNTVIERKILTDFNCQVIHNTPEYQTNLQQNTPPNRIITSMYSPERLLFILKYGITYVRQQKEVDGKIESTDQKHIMRYQQMFAAMTVREKIKEGINSGVIWHTQGSGKTALSYNLTYVLSDYFSIQNQVAKFYFIVDRLDLLKQATDEFEARGLEVKTANTRQELMEQFRNNQAQEGHSGKPEITVVNIQRFAKDKEKIDFPSYATNLQRIFIIDEAHRDYKPEDSFLANLLDLDKNAIKIALTGTPLLKDEKTGLWYCKFVYTDWNGEKKQKKKKGFKFQKDAKAFESEYLKTNNLSFDMKFYSLIGLYMEDAKVRLKATSYYGKEFMINEHIVKYLGDMTISEIDTTTIRRWQTKLISHPKGYNPTYLKCIHNQISAIFNFACKYYKLPENPARICGALGKKNADTMQFWTVAEFKQFIEETAYNHMSYVMFNLLFYTKK